MKRTRRRATLRGPTLAATSPAPASGRRGRAGTLAPKSAAGQVAGGGRGHSRRNPRLARIAVRLRGVAESSCCGTARSGNRRSGLAAASGDQDRRPCWTLELASRFGHGGDMAEPPAARPDRLSAPKAALAGPARHGPPGSMTHADHDDFASGRSGGPRRWLVGADAVMPRPRPANGHPTAGAAPVGRLHAIDETGLTSGRAVCLAPVVSLDPAVWFWPGSADRVWPLCWACLTVTHDAGDGPGSLS